MARVRDEPDHGGRQGSVTRLVSKLVVVAALLTVGLVFLPFGKPEVPQLVTTDNSTSRSTVTAPTTTPPARSASTQGAIADLDDRSALLAARPASLPQAYAASGASTAGFDFDLIALAPGVQEAEQQAAIASGAWIEPTVEPESNWVDGGNGVRLPDLLLRIRFCESTNDYRAANGSSTARGAYQFLASSWAWYGHADRYGVAEAQLATPAQQDEAALTTYREVGARPWAESRPCWDDDNIDPRYSTATPPAPAPATTTTTSDTSTTASDTSTPASSQPSTTTSAPPSTTATSAPSSSSSVS